MESKVFTTDKSILYTKHMTRHTGSKKTAGGLSKIEPFYQKFNNARCRTTDPTNKNYKRYGERGILFEWFNYLDFKRDMYKSYLKHCKKHGKLNTTLERIDNNKSYSKDNCKWATFQEQAKNRRTSRYITYKGKTMIIADWARELNVPRQSVRYRLVQGWSEENIINTPFLHSNVYNKISKTISSSKGVSRTKSKKGTS